MGPKTNTRKRAAGNDGLQQQVPPKKYVDSKQVNSTEYMLPRLKNNREDTLLLPTGTSMTATNMKKSDVGNNSKQATTSKKNQVLVNVTTANQSVASSSLTSISNKTDDSHGKGKVNPTEIIISNPQASSSAMGLAITNQDDLECFHHPSNTIGVTNITLGDEYVDWRQKQGAITSLDDEKEDVKKFVRKHLFPKLKFITSDTELQYTGKYIKQKLLTYSCYMLQSQQATCFLLSYR